MYNSYKVYAVYKNYNRKLGVSVNILISNSSKKPIYEQITEQIKEEVINGQLKPGDMLPSMRSLAKSLRISVITTQKAYEDLQRDGYVETVAGKGTFVGVRNSSFIREEQLKIVEAHLQEAAKISRSNGIEVDKLVELIKLFYVED